MPLTRRSFVSLGALAAAPVRAAVRSATAAGVDAGPFAPAIEAVHAFVKQYLAEIGAPGLTLALADRTGIRHVASFGVADLVTREPVRIDHQFQIGSISKSMVGLMVMQLVDEGRISAQDPMEKHLPGLRFESPEAPITIHHRVDFAASMIDGRTVGEVVPKSASAKEISDLWLYIQDRLSRLKKDEMPSAEATDRKSTRLNSSH